MKGCLPAGAIIHVCLVLISVSGNWWLLASNYYNGVTVRAVGATENPDVAFEGQTWHTDYIWCDKQNANLAKEISIAGSCM